MHITHLRAPLQVKTLTADPEMSTLSYYDKPEAEVGKVGQHYNDSVRDLFVNRIARSRLGVFNNNIEVAPK